MDPLLIGLAIVDEMNGGRQMRRLADGWMNREPRGGARLRAFGARSLVAVAAWLFPVDPEITATEATALEAPAR